MRAHIRRDVYRSGALTNHATLQDAAVAVRDRDIGDVVVTKPHGTVCGIVTDRERILNGPFDLQLKYESRLLIVRDVSAGSMRSCKSGSLPNQSLAGDSGLDKLCQPRRF